MFVHLIADYGHGDPAFSEVVHRLKRELPDADVQPTAVPPLSTVATGFWIEQLGLHNPPFDDLLVYSNTAPRGDDAGPRSANEGERLCYLELETGVPVLAVDAGYNLSFVRKSVREFRAVDVPTEGSQFRSRDYFPPAVATVARGERTVLGDELSVGDIPDRPENRVCHVDGYGNLKTSIRASEFDLDRERVTVEIDGHRNGAVVVKDVFGVPADTLAVAPGSAGGEDPYVEVFLRGGSAAERFGGPEPGATIGVE